MKADYSKISSHHFASAHIIDTFVTFAFLRITGGRQDMGFLVSHV
jgi:hypothetical protein